MTLEAGKKLGPYEVLAPIGAGGMGEVYKAKDTRLDRTVAIKVLPEHLAESPERKARFEREAKAISQLNHPHICTLYDVGEQDGIRLRQGHGGQVDFIVMEYIEGETLAERLKKGALKLDQALEYGVQIADGLDKAHRAGIVHRDLKPGNVMLTKSGVKLLDFGLARLIAGDDDTETSDAPTRQKDLTGEESIIGTLQYMAPEQLERKPADARTDIFALGLVLYEMITGYKAFEGESQASLIGAILKDDPPPMSEVVPISPPLLDHIVGTCLAKSQDHRWQSAADVGRNLQWVAERGSNLGAVALTARGLWSRDLAWASAGALATLVIGLALWVFAAPGQPETRTPRRFAISLPPGVQLPSLGWPLGISPDGESVLFVENEGRQIFRRRLYQLEAAPIPDVRGLAFEVSPDGERLLFYTGAELRVAPLTGGPATLLVDGDVRGLSWESDETILFSLRDSGVYRIPADGGDAEAVTTAGPGQTHRDVRALPGGRAVMFTIAEAGSEEEQIAAVSLASGEKRPLIAGASPQYASTGHLVFGRGGSVWAVAFDLDRLEVRGTAVEVLNGVARGAGSPGAIFAFADDGTLVYAPAGALAQGVGTLVWVDRNGREEPLTEESRIYRTFRLSPDGNRLAISVGGYPTADLWIYDLVRTTFTRLTHDPAEDTHPLWTHDGTHIVFGSLRDGGGVFMRAADGTGDAERLSEHEQGVDAAMPMAWSGDGTKLLVRHRRRARGGTLDLLTLDGDRAKSPVLRSEFREESGDISPDGRWIAYESNESGRFEIYVRPFPDMEAGRWQVSTAGGTAPRWSPDGDELFYLGSRSMMSVAVDQGSTFHPGPPLALFDLDSFGSPAYEVGADGSRFLMVKLDRGPDSSQVIVVENWFDELRRLVPIDD